MWGQKRMLRSQTKTKTSLPSCGARICRFVDKKNEDFSQGPRSVALHCEYDQWFWGSNLTKVGNSQRTWGQKRMLRSQTKQMLRPQSCEACLCRFVDKNNEDLSQGSRSVALHCDSKQCFWGLNLTKSGQFPKDMRTETHVTVPANANATSTVLRGTYL